MRWKWVELIDIMCCFVLVDGRCKWKHVDIAGELRQGERSALTGRKVGHNAEKLVQGEKES